MMYAVMWHRDGLENVACIPDPADVTWSLLRGDKPPQLPNLMHWDLRARYNTDRAYEIYLVSIDTDNPDTVWAWFDQDFESACAKVRQVGQPWAG